jgi:hypothetical protein
MTTSGGKSPGAARARELVQAFEALFEKPLAPQPDNFAWRIETVSDLIVFQALGSQEHYLCPLHLKIR